MQVERSFLVDFEENLLAWRYSPLIWHLKFLNFSESTPSSYILSKHDPILVMVEKLTFVKLTAMERHSITESSTTSPSYLIKLAEMRIASLIIKRNTPTHSSLIRFAAFSQNPEHFVLVIFGTKRGNLLKRGTFSFLIRKHSQTVSLNEDKNHQKLYLCSAIIYRKTLGSKECS